MKKTFQLVYDITMPLLPDQWARFSTFFMCEKDASSSMTFTEYVIVGAEDQVHNLQNSSPDMDSGLIERSILEYREKLAPHPLEKFTHIVIMFKNNNEVSAALGYGEPNWDLLPRAWPDDITAESYTYKNAWPDGMPDNRKKLLHDARSLIGFE